jgi:DNA-binding transcriptional MerR regulator
MECSSEVLTIGAVAARLGLSCSRVRQLDGQLWPARTTGGQRLYLRSNVDEFLARRQARKAAP